MSDKPFGDGGLTQAARTLLTALQWIILGDEATPDPKAMAEICTALDRFRAEGVEAERERTRAAINAVRDSNIIKGRSYSSCWMNACSEIESILDQANVRPVA